ncbi:Scr1 family TA system antitoxin-like transcriptional regulator [Nocardia fusca]|uniref:Scr1 family TA system antitoxin-like transcriptional regulator n=1 Tax=Nocardia fusca TaxID=941183 RepID=UPI0037A33396
MDPDDDWERLAEIAVARRNALGLDSRDSLAQATGLSYRTLTDFERGKRKVSDGTLAIIEQALAWHPGSAREVLRGGDASPLDRSSETGSGPSSWMRSLAEAYRIAADLAESGQVGLSGRLMRSLTDIGQSAAASPKFLENFDAAAERHSSAGPEYGRDSLPTVIGIALGRHMRSLRERQRLTQDRVGDLLGWPASHIWLLEFGHMVLDKDQIRQLLSLYGEDSPRIHREYLRLANEAGNSGWWSQCGRDALPDWFQIYLHLEQSAKVIRTFEAHLIPGLLQTADYARSIMNFPGGKDVDSGVHARLERQRILNVDDGPDLWVVLDEVALTRPFVDGQVMAKQIAHLIEMVKRPNVSIQILPLNRPVNIYCPSFSLLNFREPELPHIVYAEQLTSAIYLDRREDTYPYMLLLDQLSTVALEPRETLKRLTWMLHHLPTVSAPSSRL